MGRKGITYTQVAAVADALAAEGIEPTKDSVRDRLGTGSDGTVHRHLKEWRKVRTQVAAAPVELSKAVSDSILCDIERAKAAVRAELGGKLVTAEEEASSLAITCEELEDELEIRREEISALLEEKAVFVNNEERLAAEIKRLTTEGWRDREIIEQGRTEVAQLRNKLELHETTLTEQSRTIEMLKAENDSEMKKRIDAEKDAAVLAAKLEAEREKASALLAEKVALTERVTIERQGSEVARADAARIAAESMAQSVLLAEKTSALKDLSAALETEKNAHISATKDVKALRNQIAEVIKTAEASRLEVAKYAEESRAQESALAEKDTIIVKLNSDIVEEKNAMLAAQKQIIALDKKLNNQIIADSCKLHEQPSE